MGFKFQNLAPFVQYFVCFSALNYRRICVSAKNYASFWCVKIDTRCCRLSKTGKPFTAENCVPMTFKISLRQSIVQYAVLEFHDKNQTFDHWDIYNSLDSCLFRLKKVFHLRQKYKKDTDVVVDVHLRVSSISLPLEAKTNFKRKGSRRCKRCQNWICAISSFIDIGKYFTRTDDSKERAECTFSFDWNSETLNRAQHSRESDSTKLRVAKRETALKLS